VASGVGVAIVSLAAAKDQIALGTLKAVAMAGLAISRPLYLLRVRARPLAPAAAKFERMLNAPTFETTSRRARGDG
jgi:DNA-binding transcriptional LysR family regulator